MQLFSESRCQLLSDIIHLHRRESLFIRRGADYSSNDLAQPFEVIWNNRLSAVDKDSCPFVS